VIDFHKLRIMLDRKRADSRLRLFAAWAIVLGGSSLVSAAATQPRVASAVGSTVDHLALHPAVDDIETQEAARVSAAVCNKRVVLLGELPEHGEARGVGVKAQIVERLVTKCGFRAVLFEAGSYDFFGLEQAIAATPPDWKASAWAAGDAARLDSIELSLARAIGGLWWTRELASWRQWLLHKALGGHVVLGGLDDQPSATAVYARAAVPRLVGASLLHAGAVECQDAVARYLGWGYTATLPYDSTERATLAICTRMAADLAPDAWTSPETLSARRTADEVMLGDIASYFSRERTAAERGATGTPDRDLVMAQHIAWWSARLPRDAKIVVWTANTHAARSSDAKSAPLLGVRPLGARLAERWGDRLAVIGFTALDGWWARAGQPSQLLAALPPDALEARALGNGPERWVYLDGAALRSLGSVPSRLFGKITASDWSAAFDGVLVIRSEAPPTFEPRR
jgi:erythromycin esterase-like protein